MRSSRSITTISIVTAGHPAALRRCLSSILEHCRGHGRTPRVIVVDVFARLTVHGLRRLSNQMSEQWAPGVLT